MPMEKTRYPSTRMTNLSCQSSLRSYQLANTFSHSGPLPNIASLSLGSTRDFQLKHKTDKSVKVEKFALEAGTMIVMRGKTQSEWLHAVPKRAKAEGRMNITFRVSANE